MYVFIEIVRSIYEKLSITVTSFVQGKPGCQCINKECPLCKPNPTLQST